MKDIIGIIFCKAMVTLMLIICIFGIPAHAKEKDIDTRAEAILKKMSIEEKVGQMFLAGVSPNNAKAQIKKYHLGGIVLTKDSFENSSREELKKRIKSYQKASSYNLFVAVDEEGGTVVRVSGYRAFRKEPFASPRNVYKQGGWDLVKKDAKSKAKFLKNLGINTNLAPVADVIYSKNDYMYKRAFSTDKKNTAKFVKIVVSQFEKEKELSTLKHFPGYGNNGNTHTAIIYDNRSRKTFETWDLLPFEAGIEAGAPMVMVNHNIVKAFDKNRPASLSKKVNAYLRETLHFDGIIVSDSITMDAVQKWTGSNGEAAIQAVLAGNDLICTNDAAGEYEAVLKAVNSGRISKSRIDESVLRILKCKLSYGICSL